MKAHPDNWHGFTPDASENGQPEAVRWATRLNKQYDPEWGKWHVTDGSGTFTACGLAVRLFEVDDSPQRGELQRVNCKHCRRWLDKYYSSQHTA